MANSGEETHDRLVWGIRMHRDEAARQLPGWEELRELASQIKEHTLTHLDQYLEQFERNAIAHGVHGERVCFATNVIQAMRMIT